MSIANHFILFVLWAKAYSFEPTATISKYSIKPVNMETQSSMPSDSAVLSKLNAQFIRNFLNQDAKEHAKIIHTNFVCIESNGAIIDRNTYLKKLGHRF
jgi:hypothetical protein